ncbi:hypothetical protein [Limosilactobacillus reuteri]|uniref:hypothetical protein n=1 Tax=Limosilactobacillus reuteri TaxID=1598 RepID=UPI001E4502B7|nr:hypothetical protein [Limosilactobacillus reuteri]MCC4431912.1 hypothetical protein [Limosilactobacillus reuteri]MCC4434121.1 hypothetical protein [Limosilactobacillus reuteri]MCC4500004.1 hypothetical protein [Limosilactobacillus reuteri]MCC4504338.1 hypothetical protein [Limosilactobacillus reuteri]MCC4506195.1 hypothetical protein [Limosilactobacillus reuteri]
MSDQVLATLITTIGSIIVAWITAHQRSQPTEADRLREQNRKLKEEIKERKRHENRN